MSTTLEEVWQQVGAARDELRSLRAEAEGGPAPNDLDQLENRLLALDKRLERIAEELEARDVAARAHGLTERDDVLRYMLDRTYRESLPCAECGVVGGCEHFPKEQA